MIKNIISKHLATVERTAGNDFKRALWSSSDALEDLGRDPAQAIFDSIYKERLAPMLDFMEHIKSAVADGDQSYKDLLDLFNRTMMAVSQAGESLKPATLALAKELDDLASKM